MSREGLPADCVGGRISRRLEGGIICKSHHHHHHHHHHHYLLHIRGTARKNNIPVSSIVATKNDMASNAKWRRGNESKGARNPFKKRHSTTFPTHSATRDGFSCPREVILILLVLQIMKRKLGTAPLSDGGMSHSMCTQGAEHSLGLRVFTGLENIVSPAPYSAQPK